MTIRLSVSYSEQRKTNYLWSMLCKVLTITFLLHAINFIFLTEKNCRHNWIYC